MGKGKREAMRGRVRSVGERTREKGYKRDEDSNPVGERVRENKKEKEGGKG